MKSPNSIFALDTNKSIGELAKGIILLVGLLALIAPFAVKFYQYF